MQGATAGEKPVLFAADSTFKNRAKDGVFATEIEEQVKGLKPEQAAIFFDFDLKAYESKETMLAPNIYEYVRVFLGLKEKDTEAEPPPGRAVFLSGNGIQPPLAKDGHGIFTLAITEALKGKADTLGGEADGLVTVEETQKFVEKEITELTRGVAKNLEERAQRLVYSGKGIHFALAHNPPAATAAAARLAKFDEAAKKAALSKEVTDEGRKYLTEMPRLKALQDLRKNFQKFADGDLTGEQLASARERIRAGMVLAPADAKAYADKTFEGLTFVKTYYIKPLNVGEMVAQGIRGMYRVADNTPIPDAVKDQLAKAKELKDGEVKEMLREARLALGKREDLDQNKDVDVTMNFALHKFVDMHTMYMDEKRAKDMEKEFKGNFTGIGVQIRRDLTRDGLLVVTPIRNSPAYKAGMLAGDLVTEIIRDVDSKGNPLPAQDVTSTKGMDVQAAVDLILGKAGTKVSLKVEREGEKEPKVFTLTRGTIEVESVLGWKRKSDDSWDYYIDPANKIAYLHLSQFARNSATDMKKAVEKLQKEGVKGVVLDLRFNPGGYLDVAIDICDMFIDDGAIVSIRPGNTRERERTFKGRHGGDFLDFPMVCLINEDSASGSEILSACLQDHGRAVIMGERSHGKGSVQNFEDFPLTGGKIKLTTATFWPPSGRNLNKPSTSGKDEDEWGVHPDKGYLLKLERSEEMELFEKMQNWNVIPRRDVPPKEAKKEFKDRQLDMALDYLRGQLKVTRAPSK
jgi:C-terminal peptidase prc